MREILFRGKRVDNGEWVEGFLFQYRAGQVGIGQIKMNTKITHPDGNFKEWDYINVYNLCCPKVIPETVGQYTGVKDINDKKIFEGDILKGFEYPFFREEDGAHNYFAEVVWFDNSPAFGLWTFKNPESTVSGISHGNSDYIEDFNSEMWEVIGNIHEQGVQ